MDIQTIIGILNPILDLFEQLGIQYRIGGSVASSYYGPPRATQDVDLIASISASQVPALMAGLDPQSYYVVEQTVLDAIAHHSSFNILDLATMNKIDVFIDKPTHQARQEQQRAKFLQIVPGSRSLWISSAEDMILEKIVWWQMGGGISTRQWNDILGIIQHHTPPLDTSYIATSAQSLGILSLVQQAYIDAGKIFP